MRIYLDKLRKDAAARRTRARDEATEWLVALDEGVAREQFVDWLRESPLHVAEMLRVAQLHGALAKFDRWAGISTDGSGNEDDTVVNLPTVRSQKPEPESRRINAGHWKFSLPTAAVLFTVILLYVLFAQWQGHVIQTGRAERREVALADGSVVKLDPETKLRVKYENRTRYVFLEHGRALFRVAKNAHRPFLVEAEATTVRAVGTAFAVEQQSASILVTVAEGKVEVIPPNVQIDAASLRDQTKASKSSQQDSSHTKSHSQSQAIGAPRPLAAQIFLIRDQQIVVERSGTAEPVRSVDSGRELAWADGRLIFDNTTIEEAVREFNRCNSIRLIVTNSALAHQSISGVFNVSDPESFVAFLQSVTPLLVRRTGDADITLDVAN